MCQTDDVNTKLRCYTMRCEETLRPWTLMLCDVLTILTNLSSFYDEKIKKKCNLRIRERNTQKRVKSADSIEWERLMQHRIIISHCSRMSLERKARKKHKFVAKAEKICFWIFFIPSLSRLQSCNLRLESKLKVEKRERPSLESC